MPIPSPVLPHPALETVLAALPKRLFVETTTHCNLRCAMCVKQGPDNTICDGHMTPQIFEALKPAFPTLEGLILNGIGEPLLHPQLEEFIASARCDMPAGGSIGFQSNGLLFNEHRARGLVAAGVDKICLSVDALDPGMFRDLRAGGEVSAVQRAFAALNEARIAEKGSRLRIGAEVVVMRDNLSELPSIVRWVAAQGGDFALVTHMLPYNQKLAGRIAYSGSTDAATALLEKWRRKAHTQGVEIQRYLELSLRNTGAGRKEVRALVERMRTEARSQEIFLDLRDLLGKNHDPAQKVEEVFAAARETALQEGLELHLPAVRPLQERRCAFVEEGSAFISWEGEIHPCYNLWHHYRCYINGWEKPVQAKSFGQLDRQDLATLWNRPDFRTFRRNVLSYDYPFCSACSVAPCDYLLEDEFKQDCYLRTEPCGSCLWAMGLLQCLQ
jgi:putative metalloenzyme radical SAM/SPASM domain maturase